MKLSILAFYVLASWYKIQNMDKGFSPMDLNIRIKQIRYPTCKINYGTVPYIPYCIKLCAVISVADSDPGSGIWCLFDASIRDPESGMGKNQVPGSGSGINIPDHNSESLETIFWVKIL